MPLLNKRPFERLAVPDNVGPNDYVFYLELTNEVFLNHEDYFNRMIELNSTIWACKYTRKTNLTYAEALDSENQAASALSHFPVHLEKPILFLVKQYSCRGRFEDLVNDIYYVMKDRFFISEEVTYSERSRKYPAKVVGIYVLPPIGYEQYPIVDPSTQLKEPLLPPGENYRYAIQILDGLPVTDDGLRENITPDRLYRAKHIGARQKVKLFLKNSCMMPWPGTHYVVKSDYLSDGVVDGLYWNIVLSGTEPIFPRTPVLQRGRTPNCLKPGYVEPPKKTPKPKKEKVLTEKRQVTKRKMSEDLIDELEDFEEIEIVTPKRKTLSAEQLEKRKQKIAQQQKELEWFISEAKRLNIDVAKIEQEEKLLTGKTVAQFKQKVKEAKDVEREKAKEEKRNKQREKTEYHKKRDDLMCDDLKPLPLLPRLPLPDWLTEDDFAELLAITQFFNSYQELLSLEEIRGCATVQLSEVMTAIRCGDPQNSPYADLMRVLLTARTEAADEEDGDEADVTATKELAFFNIQQCDPSHPVYGDKIKEISSLHASLRKLHGQSVRHLPIDWMTLTEALRLVIITSGYYTGSATHRHRMYARGGYRGYEDPGFCFQLRNLETMKKLETSTVFDLDPSERMELMKLVMNQLLSYGKFRVFTEEKQNEMHELKKEIKKLKSWDEGQEKEAKEARLALEHEQDQGKKEKEGKKVRNKKESITKKTAVSKETQRLKVHLEALSAGRTLNKEDLESILLDHVNYGELDLDEISLARELQKEGFQEVYHGLERKIYDMHTKIGGLHLGRDRAFRHYFTVDLLPALVVENPSEHEHLGPCLEATPFKSSEWSLEDKTQRLLACVDDPNTCPVHGDGLKKRPRYSFIPDEQTFEELQQSLATRGFREVELSEELAFYKRCLDDLVDDTKKACINNELEEALMINHIDPYQYGNIDWEAEMKDLLLDLEEKIELGMLGSLATTFGVDRVEWRRLLSETGDVTSLITDDVKNEFEPIVSFEQICEFDETKKLAFAFLQLIQSIQLKFIQQPFVRKEESESSSAVHRPTAHFNRWQSGLMQVTSLSALSLFLSTIEPAIQWDKSRLQGKCRQCRRKALADELVLCVDCDKCFHAACVKVQLPAPNDWSCVDCLAARRKALATERRKAAKAFSNIYPVDGELDDVKKEEMDDVPMDGEDEEADTVENGNVTRTSSGRTVKKVHYNTEVEVPPLKASKRKSNGQTTVPSRRSSRNVTRTHRSLQDDEDDADDNENGGHLDDDEEEEDQFSPNVTSSSSLSANIKEKFKQLEMLIKDCMRQEFAWPFLEPVDPKEVPDYYDVIKRPMDLRTIMNKLKQRIYDHPEEICKDFNLIISNCEEYNLTESEIYECAQALADFGTARLEIIMGTELT